MKYLILFSLVLNIFISSCRKDKVSNKINAEIIGFNSDKCMCCWGWTIKIGNDTIKSDNVSIGELVGYVIKEPIKVYMELGEIEPTCSNYYNIKEIKKAE